jgi:hypothetical protein
VKAPTRPSDAKRAAAKLKAGEHGRLVLKMPEETKRAIKAKAASLGKTASAYTVDLAIRDGVDAPPIVEGGGGEEAEDT